MIGRMYWLKRMSMVKMDFITLCGHDSTQTVKEVFSISISSSDWK